MGSWRQQTAAQQLADIEWKQHDGCRWGDLSLPAAVIRCYRLTPPLSTHMPPAIPASGSLRAARCTVLAAVLLLLVASAAAEVASGGTIQHRRHLLGVHDISSSSSSSTAAPACSRDCYYACSVPRSPQRGHGDPAFGGRGRKMLAVAAARVLQQGCNCAVCRG